MADFPALPLWTDAYLADTRHLSTIEHGAYLLLLLEAWRRPHCDLPDDDALLSRLVGMAATDWDLIKPVVMAFWKRDGRSATWRQKRLTAERMYVADRSKVQRENALKRWGKKKNGDAMAMPNGMPKDDLAYAPTPTPTPTIPLAKANGADQDLDKVFWDAAKAYLGKSKAGMIGRWCSRYGQSETARAITAAQVARAVDPIPYIEAALRNDKSAREGMPIC